ncbi:putative LuxR-family transcriptional regulator [Actinoplanes missouriensis 431]|uniref:Putative LuxR-family transcriptional regulator n=1 Tax=Actinoplanes missouriensis (strain ATCC 14538 / DSM 43046 / CBS 188.64 / JCM 3121 / NBRC 102363 / NCIMB 12654 / NRRL B-3342 / UNCC 431) TaxID=512565 RepID=I0H371_ACTM4|nr:helix-turn-helix transcriptional regulator [Actinoplanes missouriensis]BAL87458.1 putative LuxR-family transcriptional regulator [Actinoplanes missouriensis 431]
MILGRRSEISTLADLLGGAVAGDGGALVLRGEAGIGKSTLLSHAADLAGAGGLRVLGTAGVQAEVHIPYAGLHRLLRAVPDLAGTAVTILGSPDTLPFRAAAALLDVVNAHDTPVLITVEDLQWLDEASWETLAFAARRLGADRAAMVLTARDGRDVSRRLASAGLPEVRLEPLDASDAAELLRRVAPDLAPSVADQVLEAAQGNPLGVVELGEAAARSGPSVLLPNRVPLSERLERTFSGLVAELPPVTRSLLLVMALDDGDDLDEIVRACRLVEPRTVRHEDIDPAVATRLVQMDDRLRVRFRHPLLRSALSQSVTLMQRRRVHAALAEILANHPERGLWHRAAAANGPDEELARELTETAFQAGRRQVAGIAMTAFEQAARLSEDPAARGSRLLAAVDMASEQGDDVANSRLLGEIRPHELAPADRAAYEFLLEMLHGNRWSGSDRLTTLAAAIEAQVAAGDTGRAANLLDMIALRTYFAEPDPAVVARLVAAVDQAMTVSDDPLLPAQLALIAPISRGADCRRRLRELLVSAGTDPYTTYQLGLGAGTTGDLPMASEFNAAAVVGLRAQGRLGVLYRAQIIQASHAIYLGDVRTALPVLPEGEAFAVRGGHRNWVPTAWTVAGAAAALSGDLAEAERRAAATEAVLLPLGRNPLLAGVRQIRGLAALAAGRPAEAFAELRRVFDPADDSCHLGTGLFLVGHLAEAAAGCGATTGLRRIVEELVPIAEESGHPALLAGLGYAHAVLADSAEAWEKAVGEDLTGWAFEQARRQHAYGTWLRRRRRPADSRPFLRAAAATFDALGATAWADRSRAELRASGESLRKPSDATTGLTPQETQIARLAAEGLSNQEIGERLFLSPRTVSTHLSRIYPKLGIRSRAELARALRNT